MFTEGSYVVPIDERVRAVRPAGQVLMAQSLPGGEYMLTVQPFGGGVMWAMPSDRVTAYPYLAPDNRQSEAAS